MSSYNLPGSVGLIQLKFVDEIVHNIFSILDANFLLLVAVTISFLCEALFAVSAQEGSLATMHADVVHNVAQFRECVSTRDAHKELIGTACGFVLCEQLDVSLIHPVSVLIIVRIVYNDSNWSFLVIVSIVVRKSFRFLAHWPIPHMAVVLVGDHASFDKVDRVLSRLWLHWN